MSKNLHPHNNGRMENPRDWCGVVNSQQQQRSQRPHFVSVCQLQTNKQIPRTAWALRVQKHSRLALFVCENYNNTTSWWAFWLGWKDAKFQCRARSKENEAIIRLVACPGMESTVKLNYMPCLANGPNPAAEITRLSIIIITIRNKEKQVKHMDTHNNERERLMINQTNPPPPPPTIGAMNWTSKGAKSYKKR